jgi:hypothetical protein
MSESKIQTEHDSNTEDIVQGTEKSRNGSGSGMEVPFLNLI